MSSVEKALLINIEAFLADNGVRRSVSSFALNYTQPGSQFSTTHVTLNPSETRTLTFPVASAAIVVRATAPVKAECTTETGSFQFVIYKSLVLDQPLTQVVLTNEGTVISQLVVIQC